MPDSEGNLTSGAETRRLMRRSELYWRMFRQKVIPIEHINFAVPKSARVEYQRLHWKGNNYGKLKIWICTTKHEMGFGALPKEKKTVRKHFRTVCLQCDTPLVKRTYDPAEPFIR